MGFLGFIGTGALNGVTWNNVSIILYASLLKSEVALIKEKMCDSLFAEGKLEYEKLGIQTSFFLSLFLLTSWNGSDKKTTNKIRQSINSYTNQQS